MAIREAMLALLTSGPQHGYQLKAEFEVALTARGTLNTGQVYTTLDRLVRDGLVEEIDRVESDDTSGDERRKPFAVTTAGREVVREWFLEATPPAERSRDELVSRVLLSLHTGAVDALEVVDAQRLALVAQLQEVRQRQRRVEGDLPALLIVDAVASALEADLGWLDRAEARLRQLTAPHSEPSRPATGRRAARRPSVGDSHG